MLQRLAQIHEAIGGRERDSAGLEAIRAALARVFDHFTVEPRGTDYWMSGAIALTDRVCYDMRDAGASREEIDEEAFRRRSVCPSSSISTNPQACRLTRRECHQRCEPGDVRNARRIDAVGQAC